MSRKHQRDSGWQPDIFRPCVKTYAAVLHISLRLTLTAGLFLLAACSGGRPLPISSSDISGSHCFPLLRYETYSAAAHSRSVQQQVIVAGLSTLSQQMAIVLDVGHLLNEKQSLETGMSGQPEAGRLFEIRQRLSDRLLLASLEVSSSTAEIDCEESRIQHLALALRDERDKKETQRTLIAIVGDAMVGIVAGAFGLATQTIASEASAVLGGGLGAGFGIAAAFVDVEHQFSHQESLLKEIWKGPKESHLFPHRVWRYLNLPLDVGKEITRREAIIAEWKRDGLLGEPESEMERRRVELFFGAGGIYKYEELEARLQMFDIVKVYIHQMNQSLHFFSHEVLVEDSA